MQNDKPQPSFNLRQGCLAPIFLVIAIVIGLYMGLTYWSNHAIPQYIKAGQFTFNAWAKEVNMLDFAFTNKGGVIWVHSYYRSSGKNYSTYYYQLDIIQPQPKQLIKKYYFTQTYSSGTSTDMSDFVWTGKYFFVSNKFFPIQFRDAYTGEVVIDEKAFIKKFPALQAGIGELRKDKDLAYITTKDGLKYCYAFAQDLLLTEKAYKEAKDIPYNEPIDLSRKDAHIGYAWNLTDKLRGELYMVKQYTSIFEPLYAQPLNNFAEAQKRLAEDLKNTAQERKRYEELTKSNPKILERWEKMRQDRKKQAEGRQAREQSLVMHLPTKVFLNGEVLYSDSTMCVLKHTNEVSKDAKVLLTAVSRAGKVLWETSNLRLFKNIKDFSTYNLKIYRQQEQLAIVSNNYACRGVALLNLQNGTAMWEYLPLED